MNKTHLIIIISILFLIGLFVRLSPHPANFTPIFAIALFAGVYLPKKWSVILPLSLMLVSDLFIGFYDIRLMLVVYGSIIICGLIGLIIKKRKSFISVASGAMGASLLFFITTNFAVWAFSAWYPHTLEGLMLNYTLAVPFFRNTLLGNLFFVGALFGAYETIKIMADHKIKSLSELKSK